MKAGKAKIKRKKVKRDFFEHPYLQKRRKSKSNKTKE